MAIHSRFLGCTSARRAGWCDGLRAGGRPAHGSAAKPVAAEPHPEFPGCSPRVCPSASPIACGPRGMGHVGIRRSLPLRPCAGRDGDEYLLARARIAALQALGAHAITHEGVKARISRSGRRMRSACRSWATSTSGRAPPPDAAAAARLACGRPSFPGWARAPSQVRDPRPACELMPLKADPVGFGSEHPPANASVRATAGRVGLVGRQVDEGGGPRPRPSTRPFRSTRSIWQAGAARRQPDAELPGTGRAAGRLCGQMGFTHIEHDAVSEYPFDGSWAISPVGPLRPDDPPCTPPPEFAPSSRRPIARGWASCSTGCRAHFPTDPHGLGRFDGTALYEHQTRARASTRLEHADLQLRPGRGVELPRLQRALLGKPTTSMACAWMRWLRCSTATTRARMAMGCPNRDGGRENYEAIALFAADERHDLWRGARHHDGRRGIHGHPGRVAPRRPWRPRLWLQWKHGLDETTPSATCTRTRSTGSIITTR